MGSWWRSRDMKYVSLIVSEDAAHECVSNLGELGVLQLTDLNPEQTPFQRRYVGYIKRCDELERKLRFMEKEISDFGLPLRRASAEGYSSRNGVHDSGNLSGTILDSLEADLEKFEEQLVELNNYSKELTARYNEKLEYRECLEKGRAFFEETCGDMRAGVSEGQPMLSGLRLIGGSTTANPLHSTDGSQPLLESDASATTGLIGGHRDVEVDMKFASIIGVVSAIEKARFERMLFRSTRGNCLVRFADVDRPITDFATGQPERKVVFIVFFKSDVIGSIVNKICNAFGARVYPVPDHTAVGDDQRLESVANETATELSDAREVLLKNRVLRLALCSRLAERFEEWRLMVTREKAIYHTLNLFRADVSGMLRAEGWIVAAAEGEARALVTRAHAAFDLAGASMLAAVPEPWPCSPPTSFQTNGFTHAYQEFVDTYGVPRYKEINPAVFTAITFPFLFGMMYGDVGHGTCIFLSGVILLATHPSYLRASENEGKPPDEMMGGLYAARYMLTMMGACAVYCGLVYNDCFSLPLNFFDSKYLHPVDPVYDGFEPERSGIYPFGVDPAWHVSENELLFFNSMKMKTAVVVGVIQMTAGIMLKGLNAIYFRDVVGFTLEFLPMIMFDLALFGYMVVLIFTKWSIDWEQRMSKDPCSLGYGGDSGGCTPPNLINQLINIALAPGHVDEPMYRHQDVAQTVLLLIAFLAVPVLLLGRPLHFYFKHTQSHHGASTGSTQIEMHDNVMNAGHGDIEGAQLNTDEVHDESAEHSFTEVFIHQCIETIEFVLGMVSNTASYLRLWALSLAHTELAQVFWEKTMRSAINLESTFAVFAAYAIFACVTAAVLLAMDLLECFLHALRLHWVEFQNKFFKADGYKFVPFSFHT